MNYNQSEVVLSIKIAGSQATRGSFSHFHNVNHDGKEINGYRTEKPTLYCECSKHIKLSNEFVKNALAEPPQKIKMNNWKKLPEKKRIEFHVEKFVKAVHPDNRGFSMEIL